jgi:hypothetical protein
VETVVKKAEVAETESVKVEDMAGWEKLSPSEKKVVRTEAEAADQAFLAQHQTRIAIGQHLQRIQSVLEPKRLFLAFLEGFCRKHDISQRTAYRYVDDYKGVADRVPEQVLNDAVKNGVELAGRAAKKALSTAPPVAATATRKESEEWLDTVAQKRKEARVDAASRSMTPKDSILAIVKMYNSQLKQLGTDKSKRRFLEETVGALMTITGIGNVTSFYPVALPEGFHTETAPKRRGRPPKAAAKAASAVA